MMSIPSEIKMDLALTALKKNQLTVETFFDDAASESSIESGKLGKY